MQHLLNDIIQAIEDEPELPGDIHPELEKMIRDAIRNEDVDFFMRALRSAVKLAKRGIKERVERLGTLNRFLLRDIEVLIRNIRESGVIDEYPADRRKYAPLVPVDFVDDIDRRLQQIISAKGKPQ